MKLSNSRTNFKKAISAGFVAAAFVGTLSQAAEATGYSELDAMQYAAAPETVGKTRAQVNVELAEAIRTGDIIDTDTGHKLNELHPSFYPGKPSVAGKTRAQVKHELAEAIRIGDLVDTDTGLKLYELQPGFYPTKPSVAQLSSR